MNKIFLHAAIGFYTVSGLAMEEKAVAFDNFIDSLHLMKDQEFESQIRESPRLISSADKKGQTLLIRATQEGESTKVKIVLKAGAAINAVDVEGESALHHAVQKMRPKAVRILVKRGANTKLQDRYGNTPLHCLMRANDELNRYRIAPIIRTILYSYTKDGCKCCDYSLLSIRNNEQLTPIDSAIKCDRVDDLSVFFEAVDSYSGRYTEWRENNQLIREEVMNKIRAYFKKDENHLDSLILGNALSLTQWTAIIRERNMAERGEEVLRKKLAEIKMRNQN